MKLWKIKLPNKVNQYALFTWIGFVSTIFFTTVLISIVLYQNFERITLNSITSLNRELSLQADNISSHMEELIKNAGMQTFYTPSVVKLRNAKEPTNFEMIEGMRELNSFVSSSTYAYSVYVYSHDRDYVYATAPSYSGSATNFCDPEALKLMKSIKPEQRLTPIYRLIPQNGTHEKKPVFTYFTYELNSDGKTFNSALIININADWLNQTLFRIHSGTGMMIVTPDTQVVASSASNNVLTPAVHSQLKRIFERHRGDGYFIDNSGKDKNIVLYVNVDYDWYFVRIIPYSESIKGIQALKAKTGIILTTVFVTGLMVSLLMMLRIYLPFRKMLHCLSRVDSEYPEDVSCLLKNLDFLVNDAVKSEQTKKSYVAVLKGEFLKQLILGPVPKLENILQNFKSFHVSFNPQRPFYLILVGGTGLSDYIATTCEKSPDAIVEGVLMNNKSVLLLQTDDFNESCSICTELYQRHGVLTAYSYAVQDYSGLKRCYTRIQELFYTTSSIRKTNPSAKRYWMRS